MLFIAVHFATIFTFLFCTEQVFDNNVLDCLHNSRPYKYFSPWCIHALTSLLGAWDFSLKLACWSTKPRPVHLLPVTWEHKQWATGFCAVCTLEYVNT